MVKSTVKVMCFGCRIAISALAAVGLLFGLFTALWPRRSIECYEAIMRRLNWSVSPIDEAREIRTTRIFGMILIVLNGALLMLSLLRIF